MKLKSRDHVIYGARLKLEVPCQIVIKVLNRDIILNQPEGEKIRFCDIILTEEEMAYVYLAEKFKFSIQPINKCIFIYIFLLTFNH